MKKAAESLQDGFPDELVPQGFGDDEPQDDKPTIETRNPEEAYALLKSIEMKPGEYESHKAVPEEVEKRAKLRNEIKDSSLQIEIYSIKSASKLESEEEFEDFRLVINKKGEALIARGGPAGSTRIPHHAQSKFTLDHPAGVIPEDYHEVNDAALSAGMLKIRGGKIRGFSLHSGGFKLKLFKGSSTLTALAIILQQPNKNLSKRFQLVGVDEKGKEKTQYFCSLKKLREVVYSKFSQAELEKLRNLNDREVVISLRRSKAQKEIVDLAQAFGLISSGSPTGSPVKNRKHFETPKKIGENLYSTFSGENKDHFGPSAAPVTPEKPSGEDSKPVHSERFTTPPRPGRGNLSRKKLALCSPEKASPFLG